MKRFAHYRDDADMAGLTAHLRLTERRLRAAHRRLKPCWTLNGRQFGDALICRDMIRLVRFERRRPPLQRSHVMVGPNMWGPQIDLLCRASAGA